MCDAKGKFVKVDEGLVEETDGGVLAHSNFRKRLLSNRLILPNEIRIPGTNIVLPYMFVPDNAFPRSDNNMRPFSLSGEKQIYYCIEPRIDSCEEDCGVIIWKTCSDVEDFQPADR